MTLLGRIVGVSALASVIMTATTVATTIVPGGNSAVPELTHSVAVDAQPWVRTPEGTVTSHPVVAQSAAGSMLVAPLYADIEVMSQSAIPVPSTEPATGGEVSAALPAQPDIAICLPYLVEGATSSLETQDLPGQCRRATPPGPSGSDGLTGPLYVDPTSRAAFEARRLENEGRLSEAADIRVIAEQPQAVWINGNETGTALTATLSDHRARADAAGQRLVVVTYAIPFRDCGSYSAGGLTAEQYPGWNQTVADALRGSGALVIVEPDALAGVTQAACASVAQSRPTMIKNAVETLAAAGLHVYIDAGHSNWVGDAQMADLLTQAGVASARGFATNVSNYRTTADEQAWAQRISDRLEGKRFVIDVSRNGNGPNNEWCNPLGRALGVNPTLNVINGGLDGLLWVKRPGESDGPCNGGPTPGQWWEEYALGLVRSR